MGIGGGRLEGHHDRVGRRWASAGGGAAGIHRRARPGEVLGWPGEAWSGRARSWRGLKGSGEAWGRRGEHTKTLGE